MLNIGIIGPGRVAERHAIALKNISNARLWSIAGRTLDSAKAFAEKHQPLASVYDNLHEMLNDSELHAVIIATPDNMHAEQIILSARAGKAILVEKPVCTSIESGQTILATMAKHLTFLTVGYHLRWHQGFRFIAQKAQNNEFGEIHRIQLRWGVNFIDHAKWRLDPVYGRWCCLSALGTHLIDLVRWILLPTCGEVVKQSSKVQYIANTNIDGAVEISMRFESSAVADIFCSLIADEPLSLEINAKDATIKGNNLAGEIDKRKLTVNNNEFYFSETNVYVEQLKAFMQSIENNTQPEVTLEEGLKNVAHLVEIK